MMEPVSYSLTPIGKICEAACDSLNVGYPEFSLVSKVIMPNHIHALLWIDNESELPKKSLSSYIGSWKREVSRRVHKMGFIGDIWQKGFYDHIVRDEKDLLRIMQYINENPQKWSLDRFYTDGS